MATASFSPCQLRACENRIKARMDRTSTIPYTTIDRPASPSPTPTMKSNRQRRVESGQPIELLSEGKYTTIAHSAAPCLLGCQQSGTVTPCTCARIRDVLTGRIVVPLVLPGGDIMMQMAKKYPQGTFAPVIFGIQGVDVHSLADPRTSEVDLVAQGRMPHASDTPFAQYLHMPQFTGVRHITVRINVRRRVS